MLILLPFISTTAIFCIVLMDVLKNGYKVVLNPFFWTIIFLFLYLVLPSFFVLQIDHYFSWGLDLYSIYLAHSLTLTAVIVLVCTYYLNQSSSLGAGLNNSDYKASPLIKLLWWIVFFYLLFVLFLTIRDFNVLDAFLYDHTQSDPYKIKNLSYLLLGVTSLYFFSERKYWIFLPNIIIAVLDLLNGSRTTALIAIVPLIICLCVHRKTLFIIPGTTIFAGMLLLGVIRSDNVVGGVPWYLNAIGEFRETYITLPLMINNELYINKGSFWDAAGGIGMGLLQPFRAQINENTTLAGSYIAELVDRGYGLGSNVIIDSLFYGYGSFILVLLFGLTFVLTLKFVISRVRINLAIVLACLSVVFIRIMLREGVPISFGLFVFVTSFYVIPFLLIDKFKFVVK